MDRSTLGHNAMRQWILWRWILWRWILWRKRLDLKSINKSGSGVPARSLFERSLLFKRLWAVA